MYIGTLKKVGCGRVVPRAQRPGELQCAASWNSLGKEGGGVYSRSQKVGTSLSSGPQGKV